MAVRIKQWVAASVLGAAVAMTGSVVSAEEQTIYRFDLPAQPLAEALRAIARQTGANVLFESKDLSGIRTKQLQGQLTTSEAIQRVLEGTKLEAQRTTPTTVIVQPISSDTSARTALSEPRPTVRLAQSGTPSTSQVDTHNSSASQGEGQGEDEKEARRHQTVELEEIVVTAQKREERLIDAPQSVSVLSSDALAKMGATQFRDFANTVPGLTFMTTGAGLAQISLRGVTAGFDSSPTVGVYVDEVPYGSSSAFALGARLALDVGLFDIDRIELLRGPQGTLYGASTMGGLLKYVSRRPDARELGVDVQTGISNTPDGGLGFNGAAAVNAPIVEDKVALRASGFYSHDGGYIDNVALSDSDVNTANIYGGRVDLLFTPSEALSFRLGGFLQDISRDGEATADFSFAGHPVTDSLSQHRRVGEPFEQRFRLVSGTVNYDLGDVALTSISSYQIMRSSYVLDRSRRYVPLLAAALGRTYSAVGGTADLSTDKLTQEVRLASSGAQQLEWLIGSFYTHERSENNSAFLLFDVVGQPAENDLYMLESPTRYEEAAAFGDLTFHFTSKFDVTGGIRYAHNSQKFEQVGAGPFSVTTPPRDSSEDVKTYLANARYKLTDRATTYVRYATGYRPGGPNFVGSDPTTGLPVGPQTFEADRLKSYEAGIKGETANRRFGASLAAYYSDWSNIQISTFRGSFGVIVNAPSGAAIRGTELELTARPITGLTMTGAFAYQDAKLSAADTDLGAADDERLPNVPRFTATVNADYELPFGSFRPTIGATVGHVSDRKASFDRSRQFPQYSLPEYTTVNLRTGLSFNDVSVQLNVHNLFDERGQLSASTYLGPLAQVAILQARTISLTATTHF